MPGRGWAETLKTFDAGTFGPFGGIGGGGMGGGSSTLTSGGAGQIGRLRRSAHMFWSNRNTLTCVV